MIFNNIIRVSIWADYADYQHHPAIRRSRFIALIADLSALGGFPTIQMKKLNSIICY
jgi:hypothetical protein